ncbi:DNA-binding transcriptional LysR family regulator [Pseudomonas sp. BIGb0408]|uniref:DNA-binding transcriptional LysR family regulator n=1 Tax=Phytopseudomonas flavescens TaxID=29435 RepID=A0A7Y9XHM9_9GAMM|nr:MULTISPECIES: LysR substrate-binding domain-containing protein [Pseudomonas]MCW2294033.1 DNA-binding transcriptional LysR family regulator [Pseudomonas sp. BIGb0408]NYH71397.1 DNA-binding transcriptional LysR family regulator [Pseudomonas flavescens]
MTLTQLEIFAIVAARGGFTSAAAQLGISQSGVSHAIRALEQELGVELLHRHQGHIVLTDIGARLLQRAQVMLGMAETMRQEALDARGMKQGTLRIGSFGPTASIRLLPAILQAYRLAYPGIEVHVDEGPDRQVLQWLEDRRIDVGFVVLPEERFDTYPLLDDQMVALLPREHALALETAVPLTALCSDPFVLTEAGSSEIVSRLFLSARLQPNIRYRTSQLLSTLELVGRGDAISIVAASSLPIGEDAPYVTRALMPASPRRVGLAVVDARQSSPATKAFIELAQTHPWLGPRKKPRTNRG